MCGGEFEGRHLCDLSFFTSCVVHSQIRSQSTRSGLSSDDTGLVCGRRIARSLVTCESSVGRSGGNSRFNIVFADPCTQPVNPSPTSTAQTVAFLLFLVRSPLH